MPEQPQMTRDELSALFNKGDLATIERAVRAGRLDDVRAAAQAARPELTEGMAAAAEQRRHEHNDDDWPPTLGH
jgi:hypothetical protein